jgi:hypothetical protein
MKELNTLIQEIVDFGDTIAYYDNPADSDFQNACFLFSCYLKERINDIQHSLYDVNSEQKIAQINNELKKLEDLISLPRNATDPYIKWTRNLFLHCEELQHSKVVAA